MPYRCSASITATFHDMSTVKYCQISDQVSTIETKSHIWHQILYSENIPPPFKIHKRQIWEGQIQSSSLALGKVKDIFPHLYSL